MSVLNNSQDPILRSGPEAGRILFESIVQVAAGFPRDAVTNAAVNLLVNVLREQYGNRAKSLAAFDELFGKTKSLLNQHYDSVTGKRRNIFPYTQHIIMDVHKDPDV